ncbi:MAG: SH3 domain-containing protein [Clostridia bacterium]|nr:SH3 domain-containing protein [Clostridia bacterium]
MGRQDSYKQMQRVKNLFVTYYYDRNTNDSKGKPKMMKRFVTILAAAVLLMTVTASFASARTIGGKGTMFVYTENGGPLNVRSDPRTGDNIIGQLEYGASVYVTVFDGDWCGIQFNSVIGWVQSRFLQWSAPAPRPAPTPTPDPHDDPGEEELQNEVAIMPIRVQVVASRSTGWADMRILPSSDAGRVEYCPDGMQLTAFAETPNWFHVTDPTSGSVGYVMKSLLMIIPDVQPSVDSETQIGTLNVNGQFLIQGKIPEEYTLQLISSQSSRIIASLTAGDAQRPQMRLTIAFDERYAGVERLNDLSEEEISSLKQSYMDMNAVTFSEMFTAAGTKLLIARETGNDEDFISIFSLYNGYAIEFLLSPNPAAAAQTLTDAQLQTAIDFLSSLEFIPAN